MMSGRRWRWGDPVEALVKLLRAGGMLAIPTESSYGLGVDPRSARGVEAVFRFKGRSADKALPVVLADVDQLRLLGGDPRAPLLQPLVGLWPAPLTAVVPIERPLPASAGGRTLAVRVPAHDRLRSLLAALGFPLTATSANPSGARPVSRLEELDELLAEESHLIVDDGDLPGGPPSTIVLPEPGGVAVLREGALTAARLGELLGRPVFSAATAEIPADDPSSTR